MNDCRNCGSNALQNLGAIGQIQPFFLKRALGLELRSPSSPNGLKTLIRRTARRVPALGSIFARYAYAEMQVCEDCSFFQTKIPFHDDAINRLYADYRLPSYHEERTRFEPSYAGIADAVGYHPVEIAARTGALTKFLRTTLGETNFSSILDYGGSDGRFLPDVSGHKFVYDISDLAPVAGATRLRSEAELGKYSLVLLAHVIEHVTHPLDLVTKLRNYVEPGGYLYLETPQEITDPDRESMRQKKLVRDIPIHEHINSYCRPAVQALLERAGFRVVGLESEFVDIGWVKAIVIRALGQRAMDNE